MPFYYEVAPTKIIRNNSAFFTYQCDIEISVGTIVSIPVGKMTHTGVVWNKVSAPSYATKVIIAVVCENALPSHLLILSSWLSNYYETHLATVLQTVLPAGLTKKRRSNELSNTSSAKRDRTNIVLNSEQEMAIDTILSTPSPTVLLKGVTGSGKTKVYIEAAKKKFVQGISSIILVPEIALTPQLIAEFRHDFPEEQLLITHSKMTEAERHLAWLKCIASTVPLVVIGPRSALFSPLQQLGLIVVDEAHEPSFKQDKAPRYNTLRAASVVAKTVDGVAVFGSATPSIHDYYLAKQAHAPIVVLNNVARPGNIPPTVQVVDLTDKNQLTKHRFISNKLLASVEKSLQKGEQSLVFHNRRGNAPMTICDSCGWSAQCPRCFIPMTLHADQHALVCHICTHQEKVPISCPECSNPDIIHKGYGTKQITDELQKIFPRARIARFDADNQPEETLDALYQSLYDNQLDIIVGTQIVAKGLDLPNLSTVGVIQAENGLFMPDFGSEERVFQLLAQVIGRVGRQADKETRVIVQTYQSQQPAIKYGVAKDYDGFYVHALKERHDSQFPPFVYLLKLTCSYQSEQGAIKAARDLKKSIKSYFPDVRVLGPAPAFYERQGSSYRWQLIVKSTDRKSLKSIVSLVPKKWYIDLDPHSLL